jgi:poly(hydroxyalkanoate) depolymerase family esterase
MADGSRLAHAPGLLTALALALTGTGCPFDPGWEEPGASSEDTNAASSGESSASGGEDDDTGVASTGQDDSEPSSTTTSGSTAGSGDTDDPPPGDGPAECSEVETPSGLATVIECVPLGMEGATGTPAPLVVALHGYTQTAEEYKDTTQWHVLAGRYRFYVVFPQAQPDVIGAGGLPAAWKWWTDFLPWTRSSFNQHYAPLLAAVEGAKARHDIDPDRVFITGLSAGGFMTSLMLATHPDVFAAGASFSGGAHNCDLECTDSNKIQNWERPIGYQPPSAGDVIDAYPEYWNDATTRKPRLMVVHGGLDEAVKPINLDDAMRQWTGALGIDETPDNATMGEPAMLGNGTYNAYEYQGQIGVATLLLPDLGHGTPVMPGDGPDMGGFDPEPSSTAADCSNVEDPSCTQDWTNTGAVYGPYQAARFFGLVTE